MLPLFSAYFRVDSCAATTTAAAAASASGGVRTTDVKQREIVTFSG